MPEIDDEGRLPLPDEILERYHLKPGTTVEVETDGCRLVLEPQRTPEEILARMDELLEEVPDDLSERADPPDEDRPPWDVDVFSQRHRENIRSGIDDE